MAHTLTPADLNPEDARAVARTIDQIANDGRCRRVSSSDLVLAAVAIRHYGWVVDAATRAEIETEIEFRAENASIAATFG